MKTSKPYTSRMVALVALLLVACAVPLTATAQADQPCEAFPETSQEICGEFLAYWEHNGGLPVFGIALTDSFVELNWDTLLEYDVQYLERERFEHHPANAGTPYNVLLGRLGVNVLEGHGIDWMSLPKANPSEPHYMATTELAIAPEFWSYWSSHGLDFGDDGVSFRESLALFGYPISQAAMETNADGDTVLTQWYERARFELHEDGTVLLGRLGAEMLAEDGGFSIRFRNELDAAFRMTFARFSSRGMLAGVWLPGAGSWTSVIGVADWDSGAQYTPEMHQRIGSITKTFTGVLILQLVDEGLLSLDDTVDEWFDGVTYGDQITLRQMLSMTSGIASYTLNPEWQHELYTHPERVWTPQELVDISLALPPSFMPGEFGEYSNTNFLMLGMIVEYVTGQTYADVLQERIFDPLGMDNSSSPLLEDVMPEPYARGITAQGQPEGQTAETTFWNPAWGFGTGNLVSTFDDLYLWGQALGAGALLSTEMLAAQRTWTTVPPSTPDMAYGLGLNYRGNNWIGHDGSLPGYNSELIYNTELDATIIVLTNSDIPIPDPNNPDGVYSPAPTTSRALRAVLEREVELQRN